MRLTSVVTAFAASWLLLLSGCGSSPGSDAARGPVILFRAADGRQLTRDDLRDVNGTVNYELPWAGKVPPAAARLHEEARVAGSRGSLAEAIRLLTEAARLAPDWPYPVYDRAFTHLLDKDFEAARRDYERTVDLSPDGFFTAITARHTLRKEARGDLPAGTYLSFTSLEWVTDPAEKLERVRRMTRALPGFAPSWELLSSLTNDPEERLDALERGLTADPDVETRGMLLLDKALALSHGGQQESAIRMLGELALDPSSTSKVRALARFSLSQVTAP